VQVKCIGRSSLRSTSPLIGCSYILLIVFQWGVRLFNVCKFSLRVAMVLGWSEWWIGSRSRSHSVLGIGSTSLWVKVVVSRACWGS